MSWFGKDNTGNYYVKIVDCHLFGFLVVDHFDSLCLFFDCIDYFNFVDHSAACWWRLEMNFLYVAVICFYTDPLVAVLEDWTELSASWNYFLDVIGSDNYSIFTSYLLDVVRLNSLINCCCTQNRCRAGRAIVDDNYLLLFALHLHDWGVLGNWLTQLLHLSTDR